MDQDPSHFLSLLACLPLAFQWPPPPGGGDSTIDGETTGGACDQAILDAGKSAFAMGDPIAAAELQAALDSGAVVIVTLTPQDDGTGGVTDGNTIALDPSIDDPDDLATLLAHEWHHVRQFQGSPDANGEGVLPQSCIEFGAYAAEYKFMCRLMEARQDNADMHPYSCSSVSSSHSQLTLMWHECVNDNMGGTGVPSIPAPCAVMYCEE